MWNPHESERKNWRITHRSLWTIGRATMLSNYWPIKIYPCKSHYDFLAVENNIEVIRYIKKTNAYAISSISSLSWSFLIAFRRICIRNSTLWISFKRTAKLFIQLLFVQGQLLVSFRKAKFDRTSLYICFTVQTTTGI